MSMRNRVIGIGCIMIVIGLNTSCSKEAVSDLTGTAGTSQPAATSASAVPTPSPAATAATPIVQATVLPAARSVMLIPEVPDYSGSGSGYEIEGTMVQADFSMDQELPLGLFMPVTMVRFEQGGSTAWGTQNKQNYITLAKLEAAATEAADRSLDKGSDQLLKYKEYLGSGKDGERIIEAFIFTAKGQEYRAEIHVQPQRRAALLPVFIQMLADVQYMERQEPIVPGVFVTAPDVGDSAGNKQALQETLNCLEAWAARDKEKFAATMHSPGINEALQFFLDNKNVYRFYELTLQGIPVEGTKRASFTVSYLQMSSEGYIIDGSNVISLLKNKQGEWKVANID